MKNVFLSLLFLASAALPSYAQFAKHDWSNQLSGETYLSNGNSFYRQNQIEVDAFGNIIGAGTTGFKAPEIGTAAGQKYILKLHVQVASWVKKTKPHWKPCRLPTPVQ